MFVDECGTHTSMARLRGRAPKGQRAYGRVPRNRGKNTTLLASMGTEGMGPCLAVEGATTRAVFELRGLCRAGAGTLALAGTGGDAGQPWGTQGEQSQGADREAGLLTALPAALLALTFSPIEEAFSKIKTLLRKPAARTRGALVEAMGRALDSVTAQDSRGWFGH